jgi:outer membrane receptor protein involved in Fe transport
MPKLRNILDKGGYSMSFKNAILRSSYVFLATFFVLNSVAQEVEEVVVTATKKEESTQDLAISVEAFTSEMLEQNQIYDLSDLTEVVPGFGAGKGIGSGSAFSMRGIGSYGIGAAVVSSLVTNINGHSVGTGQFVDLGMMDIERIEVLKGPQGTINGRNSVQGVINVITARPTDELSGYIDVETGNFDMKRMTTAVNLPINDNVKTRLAFMTNMRDGMVYNPVTGNDFDDRNDMGLRFSLDWDISDTTDFKLTYSGQKSDDNRPQEEVSFCAQDPFFGCRPDVRGGLNQAADTRGHVAGFVGFVAHLDPGTIVNKYNSSLSDKFDTLYLDREPTHLQTSEVTNLELTHDISDDVQMIAKYTYSTRDFHQMNDNDGSISNVPLRGAAAGLPGIVPIEAYVCFGSDENSFCETVDSDRTYDFSDVETENKQAEINFISDFDGPFNFSAGYYWYDDTTDNEYRVQTAGTQLIGSFANHPYSAVLAQLTGVDLSSKGGAVFYQTVLQGLLPQLPNVLAVQGGAITDPVQVATILGTYQATLGMLQALPDVVVPLGLRGTLSDQHVRTQSQAFYGEMYFDLSEDTKLTLGGRYDDFLVNSHNFNDLLGNAYIRLGCFNYSSHTTCPGIEQQRTVEDDSTSFKVALQHNLNDDVMVYGSYTTAVKAGGVNAGSSSSTYDQEETGVLDFGLKSILMDGAMLLNMNIFRNDNKGMLLAAIVDDASINYNVDAEITGFEGNLSVFLTETTNLSFNWLLIDNEITSDTRIINYMNPLGAMYDTYFGPVGDNTGLLTGALFGTTQLFKSGGYNCLSPTGTNPLGVVGGFAPLASSFCTVAQGIPQSLKGNKLPNTADTEYSLSLSQVFPSARGETLAKLSYRYRSESNSSNFEEARMAIPDLKVWDLFVRFNPNDDDWYVGMYAKNLADDRQLGFLRTASNLQGGQLYGSFSDPRTFGVQFGTSF